MLFPRYKPLRYCLVVLAVLLLLGGLLVGAFQIAVTRAPEYRGQLQGWLSDKTGLAIEFKGISARLRLYGPELVFDDAIVRTPDRTRVLATATRGSVAFDLWASITQLRLTAGRFTLDSPEIGLIRTRAGRIQLVGQSALPEQDEPRPIAVESLPIGQFRVHDAVVSFRDEITGRGPWSVSGISFRLDRQTDLLELRGEASLPRGLGQSLRFSGRVAGVLEDVEALVSDFSVKGQGLDLAGWADVLPDQWLAPETGHGSLEISSTFNGAQLTALTAALDLSSVSAVSPRWLTPLPGPEPLLVRQSDDVVPLPAEEAAAQEQSPPPEVPAPPAESTVSELINFDRLAFDLRAARQGERWVTTVSDLDLSRKSSPWRARKIEAKWSSTATGSLDLEVAADRVVLENVWPLLAYLPESDHLASLRALRARGTVENLLFSSRRASAGQTTAYAIKADISGAGFDPIRRAPGITGLTAHVEGTDAQGEVRLHSREVVYELPRMFRGPLAMQSVQGVVDWQRLPQGWRFSSEQLRIAGEDGKAQARIAVTLPADRSSTLLEMTAQAQDLNMAATAKYLPPGKLTPKTLAWLDAAFTSGRVANADVTLKGPIRAFPFRRGEGEFVARCDVEGATFNYHQGWAPAEKLAASVEFRNQGMKVLSGSASVGGLDASQISGDFPDFTTGDLDFRAQAAGDLGDALRLLQSSPINAFFGEQFQTVQGQGRTVANLKVHLPLKNLADRRVTVMTRLSDATVTAAGIKAPITALSGFFTVRQALPEAAKLQGRWLGGPLSVSVQSIDAAAPVSLLTATGRATATQLAPLLHLPAVAAISGGTGWSLTTLLEAGRQTSTAQRQPRKLTVESDLSGLGIGLPYPIGKAEDEQRPLRVEFEYDGDSTLLTRASLGEVRALVRMRNQRDGWRLDRGGIRPDGIAAALPAHPGLGIEGSLDHLNLDDWLALRSNSSGATPLSEYLRAANLRLGTLQVFGYQFPDVRGVVRATDTAWQIDVAGPNTAGELSVPLGSSVAQPLTAKLDRLVVTRQKRRSSRSGERDPRNWPNLQVSVQDMRYENHAFGTVTLQATRQPTGIRVDALTLVQEAVHGEASGEWLMTPDGEHSKMKAAVTSSDVAATLRALNYTAFLEATRGEITADLSWPGGFDSDFPGRSSGRISVTAENGQLLNVQPGAGRVLGLFSVAALPRRLALDFSDLTDKGLSFDSVHGDFELREGNAYTSNLLLRGPAAEIGIAGRTGLAAHDYDQTAVVTGNLGASLPVAGVLAGGPAVGAALLLFSQVFKEPLKGMTRGYYRITGPWENPVVERVDAAQVREEASAGQGSVER